MRQRFVGVVAAVASLGLLLVPAAANAAPAHASNVSAQVWYPWQNPDRADVRAANEAAVTQVGKPYEWGAEGPNSFDCSGLVWYSYRQAGIHFTRTTANGLYNGVGRRVPIAQVKPGDLLFWDWDSNGVKDHVAIYLGVNRDNNKKEIVEAPSPGNPVRIAAYNGALPQVVRVVG